MKFVFPLFLLAMGCVVFAPSADARKKDSRQPASKNTLRWAEMGETCVIHDFRDMIQAGQATDYFFAIEPRNANGGSLEKVYEKAKYKNAEAAFKAMTLDLSAMVAKNRCDAFEVFHPSEGNLDSPL